MQLSGKNQSDVSLEATKLYLKHRIIYSITGLIMGVIALIIGAILFIMGIVGKTTWVVEAFGAKSTLTDAPPGAVIAVVGLFIILITKHEVNINLTEDGNKVGVDIKGIRPIRDSDIEVLNLDQK